MQHQNLTRGFRIDDIVVEPLNNSLTLPDGKSSHLEPKVMEVLLSLAKQGNQTVARAEILDAVWDGQVAADELLTRAVSEIRRALGDDPRNPTYIRTIPKRGYRLIGNVRPRIEAPRRQAERRNVHWRIAHAPGVVAIAAAILTVAYFAGSFRCRRRRRSHPVVDGGSPDTVDQHRRHRMGSGPFTGRQLRGLCRRPGR